MKQEDRRDKSKQPSKKKRKKNTVRLVSGATVHSFSQRELAGIIDVFNQKYKPEVKISKGNSKRQIPSERVIF